MSSEIVRYNDHLAPVYDAATASLGWHANEALVSCLALIDEPPARVLDLGSGTGQTIAAVRSTFPDVPIDAVEISSGMIDQLNAKNFEEVEIHQGDLVEFVKTTTSQWDLITAVGVLEFVSDLPQFLTRLGGLVASDGYCCFTYEPLLSAQPAAHETLKAPEQFGSAEFDSWRWSRTVVHEAVAAWTGRICASSIFDAFSRHDGSVVKYEAILAERTQASAARDDG